MEETAFIFPGQGSQAPGMGEELASEFEVVEETFQQADEVLDLELTKLCFEGPEGELTKTENAQPAILTASIAVYRLLKEKGIEPKVVAGHSLGEYSALVAGGVIDFSTGLKLVRKRGKLMAQADPDNRGIMAAVIGLEPEQIEILCAEVSDSEIVEVANYNCPGQVVISGHRQAVKTAGKKAKKAGAKKVISLDVSGPFHSKLMEEAGEKLKSYLQDVEFKKAQIPIVTNADAEYITNPDEIKEALVKQISGSVRWEDSIRRIIDKGINTFVEVGPGRVLKGFMRRISRDVKALNVTNSRLLEKTLNKL